VTLKDSYFPCLVIKTKAYYLNEEGHHQTLQRSQYQEKRAQELFSNPVTPSFLICKITLKKSSLYSAFPTYNLQLCNLMPANLIKYANSPLYQGSSPVESLHQAIVCLGMKTVQKHVIIIATTRLFQKKSVGMKNRMRQLWKKSRRVAAFSRVLAAKSGIFDPDAAQMAGLLSDLGVIAILEYAQEHGDQYDDENSLDQTVKALRPQINSMLLQNWNLGDELVTVGEESRSWFRNNAVSADLCDLVLIARYHSYLGTEQADQLPLLSKLTDFGSADSLEFMKESQDEVAAIEQMLGTI
jgi:HD-like signal output (HDOD) protein